MEREKKNDGNEDGNPDTVSIGKDSLILSSVIKEPNVPVANFMKIFAKFLATCD